jgi:hypothetical protein
MTGEGKVEAATWWWVVLAHELAHNLVSPHNSDHSYYTWVTFGSHWLMSVTDNAQGVLHSTILCEDGCEDGGIPAWCGTSATKQRRCATTLFAGPIRSHAIDVCNRRSLEGASMDHGKRRKSLIADSYCFNPKRNDSSSCHGIDYLDIALGRFSWIPVIVISCLFINDVGTLRTNP